MKAYGPAEEILKQVEGIDGILASLSKIRCRMYLQEKQLKEAEELLNQWEKVQDDAEWFVLRAMYAHLKQEIEQREKMLELALKLDSNNMEALRMKTRLK